MTSSASSPSTNTLALINAYYASKPNFDDLASRERPPKPPTDQFERLGLTESQKSNKFLTSRLGSSRSNKMPVHPAEENATGSMSLALCV